MTKPTTTGVTRYPQAFENGYSSMGDKKTDPGVSPETITARDPRSGTIVSYSKSMGKHYRRRGYVPLTSDEIAAREEERHVYDEQDDEQDDERDDE